MINRSKLFNISILAVLLLSLFSENGNAQSYASAIRLNQIGFYPNGQKVFVVLGEQNSDFVIKEATSGKVVLKGKLSAPKPSQHSGKIGKIGDFSQLTKKGKYFVEVPGIGNSFVFAIGDEIHHEVAIGALKGFYYQRASVDLPEKFAGKWARAEGHPDNKVLIHASAVSEGRPENYEINSPKGWYDAGDYNKYIVNSGITMGTLLSLYEDYPEFFENFNTNIPESTNSVPDLLDEVIWNLRWMLSMQDLADGGVYHKLTNPRFDKMVMPAAAKEPRYVVQKNTVATLDFVAVMAQAGRIFKNFNDELPGLADSCITAAVKGWEWAEKNPSVMYNQEEMNKKFDPDVVTGAYGDRDASDEWIWASAELYGLTGKQDYLKGITFDLTKPMPLPSWSQVKSLAYYTIIRTAETQKTEAEVVKNARQLVLNFADDLLKDLDKQPYQTVMGKTPKDYSWGSSSVAANQGIVLLYAYGISKKPEYLKAATANLDYLLGRNATGYSFLTGFGTRRVMHPHHRPSVADGIVDPVPGLLSGGPNPGQQDKCGTYTTKFADESFTDDDCSYASNEIAINWNAPMVYLAAGIEALMASGK